MCQFKWDAECYLEGERAHKSERVRERERREERGETRKQERESEREREY